MKTKFVRSDGVRIAYQVFGDGPVDLVYVPGFVSHVELQWADPLFAAFLRRLGEFARVIIYDKRGIGCSDSISARPTVEQHVRDLDRVLHATGSSNAVVLGYSDGAATAITFAASYPRRVLGLLLMAAYATFAHRPDLSGQVHQRSKVFLDRWGEGLSLDILAPSLAGSRLNRSNFALFERASATPEMARSIVAAGLTIDVTHLLPSVQAPTRVMHRRGDFVPMEIGRDLAAGIPGATFYELEGEDHTPFAGDPMSVLMHIEDFVSAVASRPERPVDETKAIVFTDIVESTEKVVAMGDRRWRDAVAAHDELTRAAAAAEGGTALQSTGDGWLSVFDTAPSAVRFAWRIMQDVARIGLHVRAGVHAGPVQVVGDDHRGLTVHAAARVAAQSEQDAVLVSEAVVGLCVDAGMTWDPARSASLKGLPGTWSLHRLAGEPLAAPDVSLTTGPVISTTDRLTLALAQRVPALVRGLGRLARPQPAHAVA